ncbi:MAG: TetR family transcriptional regulator [Streptosporangiales bacterium]|nr:TetR family transcriptional regulator [Streptosporangiales bacterium]
MARNPERRTALVDAAIEVLAREGARGLTFRAVDTGAGVPVGTASNYFSTRDDLFNHVGRRIHVRMMPSTAEAEAAERAGPTRAAAVAQLQALFGRVVGDRDGYLALLELRLEATRRPELRETLTATIRANHERDVRGHAESGMPGDRTTVLLLYLAISGLVVEHLTLPGMLAPRAPEDVVEEIVTALMPGT